MNNHIYLLFLSLNKNHNEHYLRRYVKLVSFYKERNWTYKSGLHHEHHILPESFGGPDTKDNLVFITIREHFILHWMLYKAFPKSQMTTAFHMMCHCWGKDFRITSKVYQNAMLEFSERQSETTRQIQNKLVAEGKHPWQGDGEQQREMNNKRVLEGTHNFLDKEKARQRNLKRVAEGKHPFSGGEIQRKRLEDGTHHNLDKEKARQRNLKRVADGTNPWLKENQIQIECEHCKRTFNKGNYVKSHGDKCKLNPNKLKGNCE